MKHSLTTAIILLFLLASPVSLGGERRPIVAVFDIEAKRIKLSRDLLDELCDHLATRLTETGKYQVVPRSELKKRLLQQKKKTYKSCYDEKCQIEMGRELAAEKTLSTKIVKLGKKCKVNVTLYDLKKAATEAAASISGKCGEDGIVESLEKAVTRLVGGVPATTVTTRPEVEKKKGPSGIEWIRSKPAGIDFTKSEVTVAQYRACVNAGSCEKPETKDDSKYCNWGHSGRDNHPVNCVNWNQASDFCNWAEGRLPTEEEWYAESSNGGKRKYPWGDAEVTCDYAVWGDGKRTDGCGRDSTWPVCSKERGNSVSGLCDMSGNLWEWTSSLYKAGSSARVLRGGSWTDDYTVDLRASYRRRDAPTYWYRHIGVRCGRSSR